MQYSSGCFLTPPFHSSELRFIYIQNTQKKTLKRVVLVSFTT